MKKPIVVPILTIMLLVSCSVFESENSAQSTIPETPHPTALPERVDIGDGGLLSGRPCASPCVFGIRVGETQLDQVAPLLEQNNISPCQREDSVSWIAIGCGYSVSVQVDTDTNIVNGILFYPSVSVSLGDIIEKYGDPNFVSLDPEGPTEAPTIQTILYWDSIRMLVELPKIDGKEYNLQKTTRIGSVAFMDEELYPGSSGIQFGEYYKLWNGYGTYQP